MSLNSIKINTNEVIRIDEQPTAESNNLVKSGDVYNVEELALYNKANISEVSGRLSLSSMTDNSFIYEGNIITNNGYEIWWFDIDNSGMYYFSGARTSSQYDYYYISWFDSDDNYIGGSIFLSRDSDLVLKDVIVIPPNEATKAGISVRKLLKNDYNFEKSTDVILSRSLKESIDILSDKMILTEVSEESGIIINGVHVDNPNYTTINYNVEGGKIYYITGNDWDSSYGYFKISWFDNNNAYIKRDIYQEQTTSIKVYLQKLIKAPLNASKLSVCVSNNLKRDGRVDEKVEKIGSTISTRNYLPSCALSDVVNDGIWMLIDDYNYTDKPVNVNLGFLKVFTFLSWVFQEFIDFNEGKIYTRQYTNTSAAPSWKTIGGNVTNNYLSSSNDNTDRTADILTMLQSTGVCNLGPGLFIVNDLVMPDNTTLVGSGEKTWLRLIDGENKFAIKMGKLCQIHNMRIQGAANTITPSSILSTRHGIMWQGNYTETKDWAQNPYYGKLSNLTIERFSGGGITFSDTGYNVRNNMEVINCHIFNCGAGLNISYWSEYHKFTNVQCLYNYYGCINNGGNNTFVNCDFSSNLSIGFLMDNSQNQSPNNSHGSCVCCVFNHTADNTGMGIKILNCNNGFVFSGGQIFYSKIQIEDSAGIEIVSTNFGQSNCDIIIKNGGVILFANNLHEDTPPSISITNNNKVHFVNCYNRANGNLISA